MKLEHETIELRRFSSLAMHLAVNYDVNDPNDMSRVAFAAELLAERVDALIDWLEENETLVAEAS
jgi:hypothetical protein